MRPAHQHIVAVGLLGPLLLVVLSVGALGQVRPTGLDNPPGPSELEKPPSSQQTPAPLPDADIQLNGHAYRIGADWWLDLTGVANGVAVGGSYSADLSNSADRHWSGLAPLDVLDQHYQVSKQYNHAFIFNALQGIDMPNEGIQFPPGVTLDILDIDITFCKGPQCPPAGPAAPLVRAGGGPAPAISEVTTTTRLASMPVFHRRATGEDISIVDWLHRLVMDYALTPDEAARLGGNVNPLSRAELRQCLIEGAKRKLAATVGMASPEMPKDEAFALAERVWQAALADDAAEYPAFLDEARRIMLGAGADEQVVRSLVEGASNPAEVGNPLATMHKSRDESGSPLRELTVSFTAEVEISVSIPPFVTIKVKAKATVTGPVSDYEEIVALANKIAQEAAEKLAAQVRKRVEELKKLAKEIAGEVKEAIGGVWQWLMGCAPRVSEIERYLCRVSGIVQPVPRRNRPA